MKRVVEHPEPVRDTQGGRVYWKSLGEYSESQDFQDWLSREFPAGAAEFWGDGLSRRSFVKLMGASMALAGLGMSGCRRPEAHLVAFSKTPEWQVPGQFENYSTLLPGRKGAHPVLATSFNGRPVKIEGNPRHPTFKGKTGTYAQSSILDLYDPDRSKYFGHEGKIIEETAFLSQVEKWRTEWAANGGDGWAVLSSDFTSPTTLRLKEELLERYPNIVWSTYEAAYSANELKACEKLFGPDTKQKARVKEADVILSIDCNFLSGEHGNIEDVRSFCANRDVETPDSKMNRLYVAEPRYTPTGGMADHRLRLPATYVGAFASLIAAELGIPSSTESVPGVDPEWIKECANDLKAHAGKALVLVGDEHPVEVHELVAAINQALGAYGKTIEVVDWKQGRGVEISELAETIKAGSIQGLIILNGNPIYDAPVDLNWKELQEQIPQVVRYGYYVDETSKLSQWHVPAAHYLETWGDGTGPDGSYCSQQPLILPLFGGWSEIQLLSAFLGSEIPQGPEAVRKTFELQSGTSDQKSWNVFIRDGFSDQSLELRSIQPTISPVTIPPIKPLDLNNLEVIFIADDSADDGRFANNGWLQEAPDPITKITWDNAAQISPKTANALGLFYKTIKGVETTDIIKITLGGRSIEIAIIVVPGHPDNTITLPLGYGRVFGGRVADEVGFDVYPIRCEKGCYCASGATVEATGRRYEFAITQEHWSMEGRGIVREAPISYFRDHPDFVGHLGMEGHTPENRSLYPNPPFDYEKYHQWGMAIDLTNCVGCNACVISCQAENNIPIVGKDQVMKGREMHWMRVDRYFTGGSKFLSDAGHEEIPNDPEMVMQPISCQHCENAPCETVCPVNATVHNEEGLNVMAYNRCIGTRYCANNCPYKVRRFNWFDYNQRQLDQLYFTGRLKEQGILETIKKPLGSKGTDDLIKMAKNPNVTVRMRGVIEKCTFCVQRLEMAKIKHKSKPENRTTGNIKLPTDSLQVACQQVCASDAIVFGDLSDPDSKVNKVRARQQGYKILDYLNTQPRVTYLAKIRNPNPKMPGADKVGMSLINSTHEKHYGASHGGSHKGHGGDYKGQAYDEHKTYDSHGQGAGKNGHKETIHHQGDHH
ncbi:MAG: TAT-variant-translocated molybdopterin oxidoreductase [Verrucomicrobiota bacterium]